MKADVKTAKQPPQGFRIIELQAENIKRLQAVEIRPDGDLVEITGRNGQGKTSVLDAIAWAIEGADHIQAVPIRKGWDKARIRLDLGEVVVTRTFEMKEGTEKAASKVTVESADGARFPSPQHTLDSLFGALSMDPLAFQRMKPKEQFDLLKAFVPGVDFAGIAKAQAKDTETRTIVGRERDRQRGAMQAIVVPPGDHQPIDLTRLTEQMASASKHNSDIETRRNNRAVATDEIERLLDHAEKLRAQAATSEAKAAELQNKLDAAPPLAAPIDVSEIKAQIDAANAYDAPWKLKLRRDGHKEAATKLSAEYDSFTATIKEREDAKAALIAAAKLPIAGLSLDNDVVTLDGLPFDQASDAEQLRTSIAIAMVMNPQLRVIRVRDGSLLDDASMKLIAGMAAEHGYQVWIEQVRNDDKVGFYIEDGTVAAVHGKRKVRAK